MKPDDDEPSGFSVTAWCKRIGISRATFYTLPAESKPNFVKLGDRTIIYEHPEQWLKRIALAGGIPSEKMTYSKRK